MSDIILIALFVIGLIGFIWSIRYWYYKGYLFHHSGFKMINKDEQKALTQIKKKISKIQTDHIYSKGLTNTEAKIAAKVGLIDTEQMWWWKEDWQKGEREAEKESQKNYLTK